MSASLAHNLLTGAAVVFLAVSLAACSQSVDTAEADDPEVVAVGAFNFPESHLLAEIYAQALERSGVPVERLGPLGSREIVQPALQQGLIDLVPEYLGSALRFAAGEDRGSGLPPSRGELQYVLARRQLSALEAAPAENHNALVVTRSVADRHGLRQISDLEGPDAELVFGGPAECPERSTCLRGLEDVYGLRFARFVALDDPAHVAAALAAGEIDVGLMFTTEPLISPSEHVVLRDDRALQPPENVVPVLRDAALAAHPGARAALDEVSGALTTAELREMNRLVELEGRSVEDVARVWLDAAGARTHAQAGR